MLLIILYLYFRKRKRGSEVTIKIVKKDGMNEKEAMNE